LQGTGIGPALRKARLLRGKSIEEASRETRIRAEYLQALERERFETLLGDVYTRGFLRSYSSYLGLDPDKVLSIYNREFGPPSPTLSEPSPGPVRGPKTPHPHLPGAMRNHPSWAFLILVALAAAGLLAATGLFRPDAPATTEGVPVASASIPGPPPKVLIAVHAIDPVHVEIRSDGVLVFSDVLREDEQRSFEAATSIWVQIERGGSAELTVNGHDLGAPGKSGTPYVRTFDPEDYRER
jgi:cytoskeleton protein RodZ